MKNVRPCQPPICPRAYHAGIDHRRVDQRGDRLVKFPPEAAADRPGVRPQRLVPEPDPAWPQT